MSISENFSIIGHTSHFPFLLCATAISVVALWIRYLIYQSKLLRFPIVGKPDNTNIRPILEEGVAKYPDSPFTIPTTPPIVILPKSVINDLKYFTDDKASFWDELKSRFHSNISGFAIDNKMLTTVVRHDVTRNLASSLNSVQEETALSFYRTLGPCEDWTTHNLYSVLTKIVALVSGRVFVGTSLSRNDKWVDVTVNYTLHLNAAKHAVLGWPEWVVNLIAPYMKQFKAIEKFRSRAEEFVKPLHDAYFAEESNGKQASEKGNEKSGVSWFLDRMKPQDRKDPKMLVNQLLDLSFVAIHTTSSSIAHAIFDLATYREYIPILIDEIKAVIAEDSCDTSPDGILKIGKPTIAKFIKLDSFLKESIRMNPLFLASLIRKLNTDVKFSSGFTLPKGSHIAVPSWVINIQSPTLHSPGHTKPLNEFDGLRFFKLRQLPGNENRHLLVSTSPDSLIFGHGNHACPGRFFASNEIKIILIELLLKWDFRFLNDVKLEGGKLRRPMNKFMAFECLPNQEAMLEFRRKKVD
ncbi:putative cytochrome p450 monooxygenase [Erysiphe necator]|uniref:Putative cytochrome p450 monooxygenase n=1 Tax=Uncinula necator TaxID=52586 RepID=A0A0B1PD14_UNCNE|nr:putative cytochrome p450 monooxygenase [Erysiphe necator]